MFKKIMLSSLAILALTIVTGCSTVKSTNAFNGCKITTTDAHSVAHINTDIWGIYLFNTFPILSGRTEAQDSSVFFEDTVTLTSGVDMLTAKAANLKADRVTDMTSGVTSSGTYGLWVFWVKEVQVSGNAVKGK